MHPQHLIGGTGPVMLPLAPGGGVSRRDCTDSIEPSSGSSREAQRGKARVKPVGQAGNCPRHRAMPRTGISTDLHAPRTSAARSDPTALATPSAAARLQLREDSPTVKAHMYIRDALVASGLMDG